MSLWQRISSHPDYERHMKAYYNEKGLGDLRIYLAEWIESKMCEGLLSTACYSQTANEFADELSQKIIACSEDDFANYHLSELDAIIKRLSFVELYTHLRRGIQLEIKLAKQMPQSPLMYNTFGSFGGSGGSLNGVGSLLNTPNVFNPLAHDELGRTKERIQVLSRDILNVHETLQAFGAEYDAFNSQYNDYNQNKPLLEPLMQQETDMRMREQFKIILRRSQSIFNDLHNVVTEYDAIQENVINELKNWQRNQALAGNGAQFHDNLDNIQTCIELLVDMICQIITCINMMILVKIGDTNDLNTLLDHTRCAQQVLVLSAFIVEKQPPQVMKTNTRFAAAVRWLIGPKLNIYMNAPTVECIILSEAQAQRHSARTIGDAATAPSSSGEILNNVSNMELVQQTRSFSANFRNMQLKKIKRAEKKGTESVMDEKFALLFYTSSIVSEYRINVWTLSLPVVVIVHGNQEPQSWATITWDNAFSDIVREPFQVPEKVSWSQLSLALNTKFASSTGRPLTEENLNFLYEKLFRNDGMRGDHKDYITWGQFCKEPLPDRTFTFWDWFFAIMKLTKDHLLGLWKAGLIVGFINKRKTTDEILRLTRAGTFLLRFSDSELGGISVAFVNDQSQVLMLSPWTARDLNIRGLADRVHDLDVLCYVYPTDTQRDDAFGEFYTQRIAEEQTTRDGYVANTIRAHVPAIEGGSLSVTPQHHMQSPNPQDMQMATNIEEIDDPLEYEFII